MKSAISFFWAAAASVVAISLTSCWEENDPLAEAVTPTGRGFYGQVYVETPARGVNGNYNHTEPVEFEIQWFAPQQPIETLNIYRVFVYDSIVDYNVVDVNGEEVREVQSVIVAPRDNDTLLVETIDLTNPPPFVGFSQVEGLDTALLRYTIEDAEMVRGMSYLVEAVTSTGLRGSGGGNVANLPNTSVGIIGKVRAGAGWDRRPVYEALWDTVAFRNLSHGSDSSSWTMGDDSTLEFSGSGAPQYVYEESNIAYVLGVRAYQALSDTLREQFLAISRFDPDARRQFVENTLGRYSSDFFTTITIVPPHLGAIIDSDLKGTLVSGEPVVTRRFVGPVTVDFFNNSIETEGTTVSYDWDFGNGFTLTNRPKEAITDVTLLPDEASAEVSYTIRLTADDGSTVADTTQVFIIETPAEAPEADFDFTVSTPSNAPDTRIVTFTNASDEFGSYEEDVTWDFGQGTVISNAGFGEYVIEYDATAGPFTVTLTVDYGYTTAEATDELVF